jgi:hypothetical protein
MSAKSPWGASFSTSSALCSAAHVRKVCESAARPAAVSPLAKSAAQLLRTLSAQRGAAPAAAVASRVTTFQYCPAGPETRRFGLVRALRTHTKAPHKTDLQ